LKYKYVERREEKDFKFENGKIVKIAGL